MSKAIGALLVVLVLSIPTASAAEPAPAPRLDPTTLTTIAAREAGRAVEADRLRARFGQPSSRTQQIGWLRRHPVVFGALIGFGTGFLIGYLPDDDAVFDDFTASFNGLVLGGVGAGIGAVVGKVISTK